MADGSVSAPVPALSAAPADLRRPSVAWPTLALLAGCWLCWLAPAVLAHAGAIPLWVAAVFASVAAFAAFTPAHDAAHRSVAAAPWLNALVGRLATVPLLGPFPALRFAHLTHHKHVNEGEADPDHWSGRGPAWQLPLRWLLQDLYYYVWIARRWRARPVRELVEIVVTLALLAATVAALFRADLGREAIFLWLIPSRVAVMALAFSFDWLPHQPHAIPAREDRYRATHVTEGAVLTWLFLFQNYHLIHHLYPGIPFYRYRRVWRRQRAALIARGTRVMRFF